MSDAGRKAAVKVALTSFPERYALPGRPSQASPAAQDAYRQTQFLLGEELLLFERAMNLQLKIVAANSRLRTSHAAALFGFWSRAFSALADACMLMIVGSYASVPSLVGTALDCLAAQRSLIGGGFAEYDDWLGQAISQAKERQALAFALGLFRAGSVVAEDARLGSLSRLLTDLSMPHFGSTALLVAPDSGLQRLTLAFADQAFHLGWAELNSGWLLTLAESQLAAVASSGVFDLSEELADELQAIRREVSTIVEGRRRCYVEEVEGRFLFHNFRRTASGAPKRVVL